MDRGFDLLDHDSLLLENGLDFTLQEAQFLRVTKHGRVACVGWPFRPVLAKGGASKVREPFWGSALELGQNSHLFSLARCPLPQRLKPISSAALPQA
jgi:hypothetical protein